MIYFEQKRSDISMEYHGTILLRNLGFNILAHRLESDV